MLHATLLSRFFRRRAGNLAKPASSLDFIASIAAIRPESRFLRARGDSFRVPGAFANFRTRGKKKGGGKGRRGRGAERSTFESAGFLYARQRLRLGLAVYSSGNIAFNRAMRFEEIRPDLSALSGEYLLSRFVRERRWEKSRGIPSFRRSRERELQSAAKRGRMSNPREESLVGK